MARIAIGDVQGCGDELRELVAKTGFSADRDQLWFVGDLVNRGPQSLEVLRRVAALGDAAVTVLGNHDLHLLAVSEGVRKALRKDSLGAILEAPDRGELLDWLRRRPLALLEEQFAHVMVHAGIPPQWSVEDTLARAREVEGTLQGPRYRDFLHHMYGNFPDTWDERLEGFERLRLITNYLTRMRFCAADGKLDLDNKSPPADATANAAPWYAHAHRRSASVPVVFGHWAALEGRADRPDVHALDTGCVWGGRLRAMRLEDGALFHCDC